MSHLVDKYNRKIDYLRLSVTDKCNLKCMYCISEREKEKFSYDQILRYEELLLIVQSAVALGIDKIRITGGEPLLRKGIINFIKSLSQISEIKDLSITTNGILLNKYAHNLKQAGIKRVNISIDTLKEKKYKDITNGGNLNSVLDGIETAQKTGLTPVKLNVVIIKGVNDDEILNFARLSIEENIEVRFIEFMPVSVSKEKAEKYLVSVDKVKKICLKLGKLSKVENVEGNGPAQYYSYRKAYGKIGFIASMTDPFCFACNRLRVTANGILKNCLYSKFSDINLRDKIRSGCKDIKDIIKGAVINKPQNYHTGTYQQHMCSIGG